jgi:uncharacterized membrane protein
MGSGTLGDRPSSHQPSSADDQTADIVSEAQRRLKAREPEIGDEQELSPLARGIVRVTQRGIYWFTKHWLAVFNTLAFLYVGGAFLAPILMHWGYPSSGHLLYRFYQPFCHQYPFRSWFLFGPQAHYPLDERLSVLEMNQLSTFVGNPEVGYKVAFCQRDVAIYGAIFLGGMLYVWLRRIDFQALSIWVYIAVGIVPMGLDGGLQLLTYALWSLHLIPHPYEATPLSRTITGALFGLGAVGAAYPYLEEFFQETREVLAQRYG